ncbi:MAG: hypothetical protein IAE67_09965 [Candidatus Competibacteraceae bacterium]|nr:hypothetical protein [Candidatus Competibacteraceae bacterium]
MITKDELLQIIYKAVADFNSMQDVDEQLAQQANQVLFSRPGFTKEGLLDSMGLVNFLVTLDDWLDQQESAQSLHFDISDALENKEEALLTIDSLANYILLKNKKV